MALTTEQRLPPWLRRPVPPDEEIGRLERLLRRWRVHTVCHSALCPNRPECFSQSRLTFMILGNVCTRGCAFCGVGRGRPETLDAEEPERIAAVAAELRLSYAVITSVTRDDLPDGGAAQFAETVKALKRLPGMAGVEVLIPDFEGSDSALRTVMEAGPTIVGHNVEAVPRLYAAVRPQASYRRSLKVLSRAKSLAKGSLTKSGLMLGLGEMEAEVVAVMEDLREAGCDFVTLGQYLRPSLRHLPVARYVTLEEFSHYRDAGRRLGFRGVASGPLVRSSFHAEGLWQSAQVEAKGTGYDSPNLSGGERA